MEKLRSAPLLFPDLCTQLFEGSASTGCNSYGPSSTFPRHVEESTADDSNTTQTEAPNSTQHAGGSDESLDHSKNKGAKGKGKRDARVLEVEEEIIKAAKSLVEQNDMDKDMDACMGKLEKMDWGEEDPRYDTALLLFGDSADIRKVWLRLKSSSCESWVRNAGRKFGLII